MGAARMCHSQWMLALLMVLHLPQIALATKMSYIHWNISNPIFRIDNTDHIIDVNKGNIPFEYDQVNIICPVYSRESSEEEAEKYIIYNVSKEEYDTCRITDPSPRIIAVCDKPYKLMYFTITFRSFTPQPGGLEFKPGEDYYFISTSSKNDLHRRIGGRCSSHHMKVAFKICCDPSSQPAHEQETNYIPQNGTTTTTISTTTKSTTTTPKTTTITTSTTSLSTTSLKTTSYKTHIIKTNNKQIYKRLPPDDPRQNEVKTGKLDSNGSSQAKGHISLFVIALINVLVQFSFTKTILN